MRSVTSLLAAGAATLMTTAAFAADMPSIAPPPPMLYAPAPVAEDFGGWYLRGDLGTTITRGRLYAPAYDDASTLSYTQLGHGFTGGTSFGGGVGYQFNGWLRADITGEYRSKVAFSGTDFANISGIGKISDVYSGGYYSFVGMFNVYADLGTWYCVTPFVGFGVGGSYNTFTGLQDLGSIPSPGVGSVNSASYYASSGTKSNFAYALHAGLAYKVSNNFTVELAYRYLSLGEGVTGRGDTFDGSLNGRGRPFQFRDLSSQDIRIGVRWNLDAGGYAPPPPPVLVRRG